MSIYSATGELIATGKVGSGTYEYFRLCNLSFTVAGVPGAPSDLIQVEVASRGKVSTSVADGASGRIELSLG